MKRSLQTLGLLALLAWLGVCLVGAAPQANQNNFGGGGGGSLNIAGVGEAIPNGGGDGSNVQIYQRIDAGVGPYANVVQLSTDPTGSFGFSNYLGAGSWEVGALAGGEYDYLHFNPASHNISMNTSGTGTFTPLPMTGATISSATPIVSLQFNPTSSLWEGWQIGTEASFGGCGDLVFEPISPSGGSVGGCVGINNRATGAALFIEGTASVTLMNIFTDGAKNLTLNAQANALADVHANSYAPTVFSVAGTALPSCVTASKGKEATVSDATGPTYLGTYVGSGTIFTPVVCNGTNWITY